MGARVWHSSATTTAPYSVVRGGGGERSRRRRAISRTFHHRGGLRGIAEPGLSTTVETAEHLSRWDRFVKVPARPRRHGCFVTEGVTSARVWEACRNDGLGALVLGRARALAPAIRACVERRGRIGDAYGCRGYTTASRGVAQALSLSRRGPPDRAGAAAPDRPARRLRRCWRAYWI